MKTFARIGDASARFARAVVPDPFVIAILLGALVLLVGMAVGRAPPAALLLAYGTGFLDPALLAFGFQMALVLLTGHAVASARPMRRALARLADRPRTTAHAAALVAGVAMGLGLLNWGLGLVGGAFLAREVGRSFARRALPLNYPLVGAAGYMGIAVWHGGLSGSAPLKVASAGAFGDAIPISETLFSSMNLATTGVVVVALLATFFALGAGQGASSTAAPPEDDDARQGEPAGEPAGRTVAWLERAVLVTALVVVPVVASLVLRLSSAGASAVNLDFVILAFWMAGMVLHGGPTAYARAFASGAREASGILLQFPLYFGIIAVAQKSGLVEIVAASFSSFATAWRGVVPPEVSAPMLTFVSASIVNVLVPSGGGQWALQSPIILEMATALDLQRAPLVLAFSYGDQATNLLQPFWALPVLSVTGLKARDIMGYTMLALLVEYPLILLCLALLS